METFATVIVILAMIALGALAIQLFSASHDDRIATLPSGRSRPPVKGSGRTAPTRAGRSGLRRLLPWHQVEK
ncbi:hypothetical protein OG742_03270 [Streptomyces sp. NBC_00828]|uniref:hypothetical protein n=1 Tax=Streptomyces sp. NBC_00828 TaxID=2903678 RepID=UPI00386CB5D8